jgi:hypothetical protein
VFLDQPNLPCPIPFLQSLLAPDGTLWVIKLLEANQPRDVVPFGETLDQLLAMLEDATDEIAGHANLQRAADLAREDVNVEAL